MYSATYGDAALLDQYSGDVVYDMEVDGAVNECGSCKFTMPSTHSLAHEVSTRKASTPVRVWDGDVLIFDGFVYETSTDLYGDVTVTCKGDLAYLGDTLVRPYDTDPTDKDWRSDMAQAPADAAGLFAWYVRQHNEHCGEGMKFEVGVNDGALIDQSGHLYRSSTQLPTTAKEIEDKLLKPLGGYVFVRHEGGRRIIDWRYGCSDVSAQVIDFGANITDFTQDDASDDLYTVVRPEGKSEGQDAPPLTIASMVDGMVSGHAGISKRGDVLYDVEAVSEYGWREKSVSSDATTVDGLVAAGVAELEECAAPQLSIEVKAVDLHLVMGDAYRPLAPGQLVRVRSKPHGVDRYMLVSKAVIDIDDPSRTTYTLGVVQSGLVRQLDASIDSAKDAVAPISEAAKEAARTADSKRRVFTSQPTPPYDVGDLWVQATGEGGGASNILVCTTAKAE